MKKYVSIDIGGTAIKYGIIDQEGTILERFQMKTEAEKGGPAILEKVLRIVENFSEKEELCGICISTAGMVDTKSGEIFYAAPLIPDYAGINYKKVMENRFRIPCEVENDVNCAGLAEYVSGAAKNCHSSVMLTIGTGIGGCLILDGKVVHGYSGSACEVGYMHMDGSDFQTLGSAGTLVKKVAKWKQEPIGNWNGHRIFESAGKGDEICIRAIDEMVDVLGRGIANICCVINPEMVVLGGGIMEQEEYLKERIESTVKKYLVSGIAEHTKIAYAKHGNEAGMLGAFYHFRQRQGK